MPKAKLRTADKRLCSIRYSLFAIRFLGLFDIVNRDTTTLAAVARTATIARARDGSE